MSTERKTSGRVWYFYIFNITKSSDIKVELSHPLKKNCWLNNWFIMIQLMIMMMSEVRICHPNLKLAEFNEQDEPSEGVIFKLENNCKVNMEFSLLIETDWITTNQQKYKLGEVFRLTRIIEKSFLIVSNSRLIARHLVAWIAWDHATSVRLLSRSQQLRRRDRYGGFLGLWGETFYLKAVSIQYDGTLFLLDTFLNFREVKVKPGKIPFENHRPRNKENMIVRTVS